MHIGLILKKLIVEKSKGSMSDFAAKIGYSEPGMYDIFKKEDVSTKIMRLVCNELNVPLSEFFSYSVHSEKKALTRVAEESETYGVTNWKEKYYEAVEKLNACNERFIAFTDQKKDLTKGK